MVNETGMDLGIDPIIMTALQLIKSFRNLYLGRNDNLDLLFRHQATCLTQPMAQPILCR